MNNHLNEPSYLARHNQTGWKPDLPDQRDRLFAAPIAPKSLPKSVNLWDNRLRIYDQGTLGSCTAHAVATVIEFCLLKQNEELINPSRLFQYYYTRVLENTVNSDSGATLRNAIRSVAKYGICKETRWPYDIDKFKRKPSLVAYMNATQTKALAYERVESTSLDAIKSCLAGGFPFVFGVATYDSFMSNVVALTGVVPIPALTEKSTGGHAVVAIGYDDAKKSVLGINSWSSNWGQQGLFWIPYDYLTNPNLAGDFWKITMV